MKANLCVRGEYILTKNPQDSKEILYCAICSNFFSFQIPNYTKFYPHSIDYSRFFIRYYKTKLILDLYRGDL